MAILANQYTVRDPYSGDLISREEFEYRESKRRYYEDRERSALAQNDKLQGLFQDPRGAQAQMYGAQAAPAVVKPQTPEPNPVLLLLE